MSVQAVIADYKLACRRSDAAFRLAYDATRPPVARDRYVARAMALAELAGRHAEELLAAGVVCCGCLATRFGDCTCARG